MVKRSTTNSKARNKAGKNSDTEKKTNKRQRNLPSSMIGCKKKSRKIFSLFVVLRLLVAIN